MSRHIQVWDRFEAALALYAPRWLDGLRPPATEEQIRTTEDVLGFRLPEDVRYAYLRHDGEGDEKFILFSSYWWMPLAQVATEWKVSVDVSDSLHDDWLQDEEETFRVVKTSEYWYRSWVPLGRDDGSGRVFADLNPAEGGSIGQLVSKINGTPPEPKDVLATCMSDYLTHLTSCLERDGLAGLDMCMWKSRPYI